jgi:hypothetical protein
VRPGGNRPRVNPTEEVRELALGLSQHPDLHRPQRPVLLAVDQELGVQHRLTVRPFPVLFDHGLRACLLKFDVT